MLTAEEERSIFKAALHRRRYICEVDLSGGFFGVILTLLNRDPWRQVKCWMTQQQTIKAGQARFWKFQGRSDIWAGYEDIQDT